MLFAWSDRLHSRRLRTLGVVLTAAVVVLVVWQLVAQLWPQPKVVLNRHYTALSDAYTFSCPTTWRVTSYAQPAGVVTTATFTVSGKTYAFVISPPGQVSADADALRRSSAWFTYGKMRFYRTVLSTNGKAFYVAATTPGSSYIATMQLPAKDANKYLSIFGQILATLQYKS